MAIFHIQYPSKVLGGEGEFLVILPERAPRPYKVLWLLHGAFGEAYGSIWDSSIIRYALNRGLAIVAPSSYMGVYTDMIYGEAGYSLVKEVLEIAPKLCPCLSVKPEDSFLMGISMGGHGSFKLALEFPERFAATSAFSSPIDMVGVMTALAEGRHGGGHELVDAFGSADAYRGTIGDILHRAKSLKDAGSPMPRMFLAWGDNEHASGECNVVAKCFAEWGIPLESRVGVGGHSFDTWDPMLPKVLDWMLKGEYSDATC